MTRWWMATKIKLALIGRIIFLFGFAIKVAACMIWDVLTGKGSRK